MEFLEHISVRFIIIGSLSIAFFILVLILLFDKEDIKKAKIRGIVIKDIFSGILVIGGAGSFKTKGVLYDLLKVYFEKQQNLFIYDHKGESNIGGELLRTIRGILSQKKFHNLNYEISVIDFENPQYSFHINLLEPKYYADPSQLKSLWLGLYDNMLGGSTSKKDGASEFYRTTTVSILTAISMVLVSLHKEEATIPNVVRIFYQMSMEELEAFVSQLEISKSQAIPFLELKNTQEQLAIMKGVIASLLSFFDSPNIFWVLHKPDNKSYFDLNSINQGDKSKVVIITNSFRKIKYYSPILASIFETAIRLIAIQGRKPLQLILDEGAQLPVQRFSDYPSQLRSYKIGTNYVIQDFSVAYERMGKDATHAIISNLSTQFYGKINDSDTAHRLEKIIEEREIKKYTRQIGLLKMGGTYTKTDKRKFMANDFVKLRNGKFIVFASGKTKKISFNKIIFHNGKLVREVVTKNEIPMNVPLIDENLLKQHYDRFFMPNYVQDKFFTARFYEALEKITAKTKNTNDVDFFN